MQKNPYPGKFIVIEGPDGSGQSTQVSLLGDFLIQNGHRVVLTKEPTKDSEAGKKIRDALTGLVEIGSQQFQELFAEDRAEHLKNLIIPALQDGKIVISDRYCFTSFAYGAAEGIDLDYLIKINENFLMPDLAIILRVSPEVCLRRIEQRGAKKEFFERINHFTKAAEKFEILPERFKNVYIMDGEKSVKETFEQVKNLAHSKLNL